MEIISERTNEELLNLLQHGGEAGFSIIYRTFWSSMY